MLCVARAVSSMKKAVTHLAAADPVLAHLIQRVGPCRLTYRTADFAGLARSIVFQQLSGKAAATIFSRLEAATGAPVTPRAVLKLTLPAMRALGLSAQKSSYLQDLAAKTESGEIDFARLPALDDAAVIEHLTQVKGVGVWTVQMLLIFALKRRDVLPTADLGIRTAIKRAYHLEELPQPAEMIALAEPWRPYRSIASWYLWRSLDGPAAL
jgi:DNA-3-methyladenine glycosylase II